MDPELSPIFHSDVPPPSYSWKDIVLIVYCALPLLASLLFGIGIIASQATYDQWDAFYGHNWLFRLVEIVLGSVLVLTPVFGFILRGERGWVACLSCYYFLCFIATAAAVNRWFIVSFAVSLIAFGGIAAMHQSGVIRFFETQRPQLRKHGFAALWAGLLFIGFICAFALRG